MVVNERKRILLSELEDELALDLIRPLYEHNRTHDVLLARTAEVARVLLQGERFSAVVLRCQPGKLAALNDLSTRHGNGGHTRFVAVSDADGSSSFAGLCGAGADRVVPGSTRIDALADEIIAASLAEPVLAGRLEQLQASDLIQCLCMSRRSLMIRIIAGGVKAALWLEGGAIQHAISGTQTGLAAISALLAATSGQFWAAAGKAPERSIQLDWQHALIEAARLGDEEAQWPDAQWPDAPPDQTGTRLTPVRKLSGTRRLGKTYRELNELGLECMKAGDFAKAQEYWSAARQLGDQDDDSAEAILLGDQLRGSALPASRTSERNHS
jgi:uncharacterized protein DUF4388